MARRLLSINLSVTWGEHDIRLPERGEVSMRNFKRVFVTALITGLALSASADIFAQRQPGRSGNQPGMDRDRDFNGDRRFGNGHRNRGGQFSVESEFIGKTYYPGEVLHLRKELGLGAHKGKEIEKVELEIEGMRRGGVMTLEINGQQVSRPQNFYGGRVGDQVITFNLHRPFIIGESARKIQVRVDGTAYIREALVILKSTRGGQNSSGTLQARVNKDVIGQAEVEISQLVQANFRQEQKSVRFIELEFQSYARLNQMRLCNGDSFGFTRPVVGRGFRPGFDRPQRPQRPGQSMNCQGTKVFHGNGFHKVRLPVEGQALKDIKLFIRGDLTIKKVTVAING